MPKVTAAHREKRRRQITDGARRAFGEHGYVGATVEVLERQIALWLERGGEGVVRHIVEDDPEWLGAYLDASRMLRTDPELRERWRTLNPEGQAALEAHYRKLQESGEIRDDVPIDT